MCFISFNNTEDTYLNAQDYLIIKIYCNIYLGTVRQMYESCFKILENKQASEYSQNPTIPPATSET